MFEPSGDRSVDDFGISSDAILVGLDGYVVVWALVDDLGVVGAVEFVRGMAEEVRDGLGIRGAIVARGWTRVVEGTEWTLTRSGSILGFAGDHGGGAEISEGDGAWAVGMVIKDGQ